MKLFSKFIVAGGALLAVSVAPAQALVIGAPGDANTGNCYPFGCTGWGTEYQQVYASTDFSGPITITDIRFYHLNYSADAGTLNSGTFTFSLSTTSAPVNGLSSTLANNLGLDNTQVFSGTLPGTVAFGSFFDVFVSPFTYDPANGNLLLDILSADANGGQTFLDAHNGTFGDTSSRATNGPQCADDVCASWGLVTGFNENTAVPEPLTLSLFGAGFAGAAALRRRKKIAA